LGIDAVELGRLDQREHDRRSLSAAVGASEPANSFAFQPSAIARSWRSAALTQADAPDMEEAGKGVDPLEHLSTLGVSIPRQSRGL
jgi:hypothetical protein